MKSNKKYVVVCSRKSLVFLLKKTCMVEAGNTWDAYSAQRSAFRAVFNREGRCWVIAVGVGSNLRACRFSGLYAYGRVSVGCQVFGPKNTEKIRRWAFAKY